jgi:hypothetical protein
VRDQSELQHTGSTTVLWTQTATIRDTNHISLPLLLWIADYE